MMHYPASGKAAHRRLHTPFQADTPYKIIAARRPPNCVKCSRMRLQITGICVQ